MRDRHGGLQQQQALFRVRQIDARDALALYFGGEHLVAAALGDPFVVVSRVERVGGEFESALSFDAAVACRAVAAALGEDAGDLAAKADRADSRGVFDRHRGAGLTSADHRGHGERSVRDWRNLRSGDEFRHAGLERRHSASAVTSRSVPSAYLAIARNCWVARAPFSAAWAGTVRRDTIVAAGQAALAEQRKCKQEFHGF